MSYCEPGLTISPYTPCAYHNCFNNLVSFDDPLQALEFARAKVESLVAYCSEADEEGKIGN